MASLGKRKSVADEKDDDNLQSKVVREDDEEKEEELDELSSCEGPEENSSPDPDVAKKQALVVNCKVEIATALPQNTDNYGLDIQTAYDELGAYLHKIIPESPFNEQTMIDELNLTLPSRYIGLFNAENVPEQLLNFLYEVIVKFPKAKLIQFPHMRLEPAYRFSEMLQNKIDSHSIKLHYDVVSLSLYAQFEQELSNICSILQNFFQICKANELLLFIGQDSLLPELTTAIKNSLPTQIDEYPTVKINNVTILEGGMPPLNENIHSFASSDANSTFTFDSYLQPDYGPLNVPAEPSTAYNYWQLQRIHKKFGYTGKGIKVAVIDTGITFHAAFPNLSYDQIMRFPSRCPLGNFDWVGHGTQCAGIICGKEFRLKNSNGTIVSFPPGVAPDAELTVCKVSTGSGDSGGDITYALEWLVNEDIDVVNISMGSLDFSMEEAGAISDLVKKGVIVVCAASNDGHRFSQPINYPALLGNVLCIGSHGRHGKPSPFSPVGQQVDFLAPGEEVYCPSNTIRLDSVVQDSGTSFAAPAVAGLVCLILQYIKEKVPPEEQSQFKNHWAMKQILRKISTCPGRHDDQIGFGALNPLKFFRNPPEILKYLFEDY